MIAVDFVEMLRVVVILGLAAIVLWPRIKFDLHRWR